MKNLKSLFNDVFLIKKGETAPLFHFWFVFMLTLGIGLAIGRASADALFLSRYGIEFLPVIYIALAPLLALVSIFYAALVDRLPSEIFFRLILTALIISVLASWIMMSQTDITLIYPIYYIIHKIASELLLVHGTLYLAHNFNTLQAKRLFPLIFTGEQLGCVIGGLLVSVSTSFIETDKLPLLWALLMIMAAVQLSFWHSRRGASPYFLNQKKPGSRFKAAIQSVYQGLTFARESPLLRNASFALFFLVIIYYILSYSTSLIFVRTFSNEQELAKFLGLLTAITSVITLGIQLFLTNRFIERFGIRKLNLTFPVVMASAACALLVSFTLSVAIITSIVRDSLLNSLQNPLRVMFFNALPNYMQGRARAVSIVFVMPVALLVCGSLLWGIQQLNNVAYFLLPCFIVALAFLYYSQKMNQTYTQELTTHLKDSLYFPEAESSEVKLELDTDTLNSLQDTFNNLPQARSLIISLLATHYPEKSVNFIIPRLNDMSPSDIDVFLYTLFKNSDRPLPYTTFTQFPMKDAHLQATLLKLLADKKYPEAKILAIDNLCSPSSRVRAAAAYAILKNQNPSHPEALKVWQDLVDGNKHDRLSSLVLIPLINRIDSTQASGLSEKVKDTIEQLLKDDDLLLIARTLKQLPEHFNLTDENVIYDCVQLLSNNANPNLRESAAHGLKLLSDQARYEASYKLLNDSHTKVRSKALSTLDLNDRDYKKAVKEWLLKGFSSPRVQSVILKKVIQEEIISHNMLSNLAQNRACDANDFGIAKNIFDQKKDHLNSNQKLLSLVLGERQIQLIDLALQALTSLCAEGQIAVIRAGLISKQNQLIAKACEILNNIENQPATDIIEPQLQNKTVEGHNNVKLLNTEDVLLWAGHLPDYWVSHVANIVRGTSMNENTSRNIIERITLLKQTDIFSEVPTDDLLFVAKELEEIKYFSGDRVFDINESGDRMYIIVYGQIGISISPDPTSRDFIITLGSGSSFGEMNLLDNIPRSASAHVLEDTFLLTLEKNKLLGLLKSYPELSLGVLRALSFKVRENHDRNNELKRALETNH